MAGTRKFWGWGVAEADLSREEIAALARTMQQRYGVGELTYTPPPRLEDVDLPAPRVQAPAKLAGLVRTDPNERAQHTYGKAFKDVVRGYARDFGVAPDGVALPTTEAELAALLDWCGSAGVAAIPYGAGSSVVQGTEADIEARYGGRYKGALCIDLRCMGRILEVDKTSRAARIEAGIYGPALDAGLKPHGLTLRHFPQSYEFSTLGGWIATRSGGHYATLYTHIDEFVESLRVLTPTGPVESFRLPGSGAGPSPDRFFIGSEGALGIITSAWMRVQDRPTFRASASLTFPTFLAAAEGVRAISQAALFPANVRILDPGEALMNGVGDGKSAVMVLGFESADHPVDAWFDRAIQCARDHGGTPTSDSGDPHGGEAGAWREAFIRMPYVRDALVGLGMVSETYETAITWERFPEFHAGMMAATEDVVRRVCGAGTVTCRFTHAYPDGPAPYYSITAPGKHGSQLGMMEEIKAAVSERLIALGGTITHHHAVGRYHRPWYDQQIPEGFRRALKAAKAELDPAGVLNPGVLVDPA